MKEVEHHDDLFLTKFLHRIYAPMTLPSKNVNILHLTHLIASDVVRQLALIP